MFDGQDLARLGRRRMRPHRRSIQMVFQDPAGSLNPRLTVEELLVEPLQVHGLARGAAARIRARELMEMVGLEPGQVRRYPHEFSGGQRQRIGIARALSLEPRVLVLDEPVSALDVSVQAQVLDLLAGLKARLGLTYLFIAHDLAVVRSLSDRVAVMYLGEIVESGATEAIYGNPLHPYTKALLAAVPRMDREARTRRSAPPLASEAGGWNSQLLAACQFEGRCGAAVDSCRSARPPLVEISPGRWLRCPVAGP
jgi:oligopeptide/dipeptide ABC transporter ATP-binding protein